MKRAVSKLLSILWARVALRKCELGGRWVRLRGRPHINANGTIRIGQDVSIHSFLHRVQLSAGPGARLIIGDGTFLNNGVVLSARNCVSIGNRCQLGPHVIVMDCDFHGVDNRTETAPAAPIIVEDDVWLATRVTILKGVRIGRGSVVAAGAVVTKDVAPYTLVGGVPARLIRSLNSHDG